MESLQNKLTRLGADGPRIVKGSHKTAPVRMSRELARILALPSRKPACIDKLHCGSKTTCKRLGNICSLVQLGNTPCAGVASGARPGPLDLASGARMPRESTHRESAGTRPGAARALRLRPAQASALAEARRAGGLLGALSVGCGKTLLAFLLPSMWPALQRPLLLCPARLKSQATLLAQEYLRDFRIRTDTRILSYHDLADRRYRNFLWDYQPDIIIADECHKLRNVKAVGTGRLIRYLRERTSVVFCGLSGTITNRSILDYAHLLEFALRDRSPVPRPTKDYGSVLEWADSIDVVTDSAPRPSGALDKLRRGDEMIRQAYRRRLTHTRGVIVSAEFEVKASLTIGFIATPKSRRIDRAERTLRQFWQRPDGEEFVNALEVAKAWREIRLGGYYSWRWNAACSAGDIRTWLEARKLFNLDVRDYIARHKRRGVDSPALVIDLLRKGDIQFPSFDQWTSISSRIPPHQVRWRWLSKVICKSASDYGSHRPCIIWCNTVAVGRAIAKLGKYEYYGAGEASAIGIAKEDGSRTIVASIQAHGTGRNLQSFSRNLLVGCPANGAAIEQLLGRTHRYGQCADEVTMDILDAFRPEFEKARKDAKYIEQTTGLRQKVLYASIARE